MNCNQKSGIFLNITCANEATKQCSNCDKKVCNTHHHILNKVKLCEDCYWEFFLYSEEQKINRTIQIYDNGRMTSTTSSSSSSNEREGFEEGFGGGTFGGGGASGAWTDGDKEGFNATDIVAGAGLSDNDNTFFYS